MNETKTALEGTLPASWYSTKAVYELERRAIFGRRWLMISDVLRFANVGSYAKFTIAGYPFFIIRDRERQLNAFLNVCRHRAFPVVLKDEGTASILACKYHGWSYNLKGGLAKAPKFDTAEGFDKGDYSLFRVHLKVDSRGFIWVNLDSAAEPEVSWEESFEAVDKQQRLQAFDMDGYRFDFIRGRWQCYHCSVAHPGIAKTTNLNSYDVNTRKAYIEHYAESKGGDSDTAGDVAPTFLFPNASITMTPPYFYLMRVVPISETQVSMQYEVYRHMSCGDSEFKAADEFFKQIESEDKFLCTNAQKNLNAGGYVTGPLHPHNEKGVLHFKSLVRESVFEHWEKEKRSGHEISPVRRSPNSSGISEEELLCKEVCAGLKDKPLIEF